MNKEYTNAFSDAYLNIMPQLGVAEVKLEERKECGKKMDASGVVCIVGVIGDLAGNVIFSMTEDTAKRIASYMMGGMEVVEFDEISQSAISELSNMLAANACIGLSEMDLTVDISTPTLINGVFTVCSSFENVISLQMKVDELDFFIYISLELKKKG